MRNLLVMNHHFVVLSTKIGNRYHSRRSRIKPNNEYTTRKSASNVKILLALVILQIVSIFMSSPRNMTSSVSG